jgi:hypothetical protein
MDVKLYAVSKQILLGSSWAISLDVWNVLFLKTVHHHFLAWLNTPSYVCGCFIGGEGNAFCVSSNTSKHFLKVEIDKEEMWTRKVKLN